MFVVVVVVVAVVVVVVVVVDVVARRARAPNTPLKTDSKGARARGAEQQQTTGKNGSPQTAKTMVFTMFLQQARKQKLKIRIAKQQKHCILRCFWPVVRKLAFRKVPKTS